MRMEYVEVARAESERGELLRFSVVGPDGSAGPDPAYGGQLQDRAINGVVPDRHGWLTHVDIPTTKREVAQTAHAQ